MPSCNDSGAVEDIEDFINKDTQEFQRTNYKETVVPRARIKKAKQQKVEDKIDNSLGNAPGIGCVYVKTWGCTHNTSDSEYMAGQLAAHGYTITDDQSQADLWLLNSCTVKNPAEDHFRNMIEKARASNKHVVLSGCVPQGAPSQPYIKGLSIIGVQQIDRVVEVVEETLKGNSVKLLGQKKENNKKIGGAKLSLPKIRRNPLIEIISINTGCLNQCTYCKTRYARGVLASYPVDEIVQRARDSFGEGVVELWITSEDTGAYGRDIGTDLPTLLKELVKVIPHGCMMRVGMTNPPYILEHLEEIGEILLHPRVYAFMHVPVQAGSDRTLYEMRREYDVSDFCRVVDTLMEKVPGVSIATDVICGFPSECREDFEGTMGLVRKYKFPSLFINQFFPRPGTPAAKMEQIDRREIKRRTKMVSDLFRSYTTYDDQLGLTQQVLVTDVAHDGVSLVGHNKFYHQVLLQPEQGVTLMGKTVTVEITECGKHFLRGRRVEGVEIISPTEVSPLPHGQVSGVSRNEVKKIPSIATRVVGWLREGDNLKKATLTVGAVYWGLLLARLLRK